MTLKASALRSPRSPYVPINHMNSLVTHLVYLCLASILLLGITNRPSSVLAAPNTKQLAKSAFKKGKVAFDEGRYSDALLSFDEAYQHFPLPLMLYNIANVYERLNLYPQALTKYKAFIRTGKDSNGEAEKKMKVIEEKIKDWPEVLLTSTPSGASLRLYSDEHPILGQTPLKQKLPVLEELPIYLTPAEGETIKKFVTVRPDLLRQTININLREESCGFRLTTGIIPFRLSILPTV
jgi:tetratricopeptide (TPR) repeat protein